MMTIIKESDYQERVVDEVIRIIVPAFPPTRKSQTHYHTATETWFVETLDDYPIPEEIQTDINAHAKYT